MGKAVPKAIKMRVETLLEEIHDKLSPDFEKNKALLYSFHMPFSKVDRNIMAAYITRRIKAEKKK
ncbi:MAG: 30S ribosomal protein S17e [Candidatus ainarchaeum sp.]|nr:30S ribosomal protein S17e [Candidatus ainarchaeum sp.]